MGFRSKWKCGAPAGAEKSRSPFYLFDTRTHGGLMTSKRIATSALACTWCLDQSGWKVPVNHLLIVYCCCQPTAMSCSETLLNTCSTPPCPAPIPRSPLRKEGSQGNLDLPSEVESGSSYIAGATEGEGEYRWGSSEAILESRKLRCCRSWTRTCFISPQTLNAHGVSPVPLLQMEKLSSDICQHEIKCICVCRARSVIGS